MKSHRQKLTILLLAAWIGIVACAPEAPPAVKMLQVDSAAGSMGANLIRGADGSTVLSWIEPDATGHALRFSTFVDGSWSAPRTVARGDNWFVNWADFPSVVPISNSLWAAHWLQSQPAGGYAYDVRSAVSTDRGDNWSESIIPHDDNTDTEHGFVTLFPSGDGVGMVWLDGRKMVNEYDENDLRASAMTLRSATFGKERDVRNESLIDDMTCDCCQTDVAVSAEGPVLVYRDRNEDEIRDIYISRQVDGEWQPGVAVARDDWEIAACPVNGPVIQAAGTTVAVAWFTAANNAPMIKVAWSGDSGRTFTAPIEVSADRPLGHVGASLLENGDVVVSWLKSGSQGSATLMLSHVSSAGAATRHYAVSEASGVFAFSVPQVSRIDDDLLVAWTTEIDGIFGISSALVPVALFNGV